PHERLLVLRGRRNHVLDEVLPAPHLHDLTGRRDHGRALYTGQPGGGILDLSMDWAGSRCLCAQPPAALGLAARRCAAAGSGSASPRSETSGSIGTPAPATSSP